MSLVLFADGLTRHFPIRQGMFRPKRLLHAVNGVSLSLEAGRTLAIVGESGCGKSTLARMLAMIEKPNAGTLEIVGKPVVQENMVYLRPLVQMVFQNPFASLNPRKTIGSILAEPLIVNTRLSQVERNRRVAEILEQVGLRSEYSNRYPHMFSGGQQQRIAIARAMILNPKIVIADEPTSALDVSVQAQILNLFSDLQRELGTSFIFVSHDMSVVRHVADDVMVMYLGSVVEHAPTSELFSNPRHPYTKALLSATPTMHGAEQKKHIRLHGELPSPLDLPSGCAFRNRCAFGDETCALSIPQLNRQGKHGVACFKS